MCHRFHHSLHLHGDSVRHVIDTFLKTADLWCTLLKLHKGVLSSDIRKSLFVYLYGLMLM